MKRNPCNWSNYQMNIKNSSKIFNKFLQVWAKFKLIIIGLSKPTNKKLVEKKCGLKKTLELIHNDQYKKF